MAGTIKTNNLQLGDSATATQNFTLQTNVDGTAKLARGTVGATTQDILTVASSGKTTMTQGGPQFPRAWVVFDGTNSVGADCTLLASFGVASVRHVAAGDYRLTFSNTQPDANHAVICLSSNSGTSAPNVSTETTEPPTTTTVRINCANNTGTRVDSNRISIVVYGV